MSNLSIFIRTVRNRSHEHEQAMRLLSHVRLTGQMIAVLRQELDSMIRVIYLLKQDNDRRNFLIDSSVNGKKWTKLGSNAKVSDKEMVELSQHLEGWTRSVYKFGCSFIHLSRFHDYNDCDPLQLLPDDERESIIDHCRYYHGGPAKDAENFEGLIPYIPRVFEKISSNLEYYIRDLEEEKKLDETGF